MADIGISVGLDTSQLQQGAKGAADSIGEMYEQMAKLQTAGEKRNAIYEYMNNANQQTRQVIESLVQVTDSYRQVNTIQEATQNPNPQVQQIQNQQPEAIQTANPQIQNQDELFKKLREANISRLKSEIEVCNEKLGEMYANVAGMNSESKEFADTMQNISQLEFQKQQLQKDLAVSERKNKPGGNIGTDLIKRFFGGGNVGFLGRLGIGGAIAAGIVKAVDMGLKTYSGKIQTDIAAEGQYLNGDVINANIAEKENSWWTHIPLVGGTIKSGIQVFDTNEKRKAVTELNGWIKESAPTVDSLSLYGDLNQGNAIENSRKIREDYSRMARLISEGNTGYSTNEGVEVKNQFARYGLTQENAELDANSILKWQRATGAGRNELLDFVGYSARYGNGQSATSELGFAYGGLAASGMEKGQLSEFLRGIQSAMEEGVSKGFSVSAEAISRNMSFLSKLSGNNAMWSGENAARKISGINSSIESSTNLDSVSAVMNYQVASSLIGNTKEGFDAYAGTFDVGRNKKGLSLYTGTPLDVFMAMEKGMKPKTVGATMTALQKQFGLTFGQDGSLGGDVLSAATMLSQMWGLNNTGSVQMLKSWALNGKITDDEIKKITANPEMLTKETQTQKLIESIKTDVAKIASTGMTTAENILKEIQAKNGKKLVENDKRRNLNEMDFDSVMDGLYSDRSNWSTDEGRADSAAYRKLKNRFKKAEGTDADTAVKILDAVSVLSEEEKDSLDTSGAANDLADKSFDEILEIIRKKEFGIGNKAIMKPFDNPKADYKYSLPGTQKKRWGLSVPYTYDEFLRNEAAPLVEGAAADSGTTVDKVITQIKKASPYMEDVFNAQKSDGVLDSGEMKVLLSSILAAVKQQTANAQMLKEAMENVSVNVNIAQQ